MTIAALRFNRTFLKELLPYLTERGCGRGELFDRQVSSAFSPPKQWGPRKADLLYG